MPYEFGARRSVHKGVLTLHSCLTKPMVIYLVHKYVAVSFFVYLREYVLCNQVGEKFRLITVLIFNLLHTRIQDRFIIGLSDWNTIGIA